MMKNFSLFIAILLLVSCTNVENQQKEAAIEHNNMEADSNTIALAKDTLANSISNNQRSVVSNKEFLNFYQKLTKAIQDKDVASFNKCMGSNFGVYIIEATGAIPIISKVYDISKFKLKSNNNNFFQLPFKSITSAPIFDELPKVICEEAIYDKSGCFAAAVNPIQESQLWNYSDLNEKEIQAIEKLASLVNMTVINTDNCTFYFSFNENKWSISFIDLRIPCQA